MAHTASLHYTSPKDFVIEIEQKERQFTEACAKRLPCVIISVDDSKHIQP